MKQEILDLFTAKKYRKAEKQIKELLKKNTDDGELYYYLFLAENDDYANMDMDAIVGEVNFNTALEKTNRRLKNQFEAEYHFFKACDENFKELFCYALRGNRILVLGKIDSITEVKLSENEDEYFSNLDFIVNSRKDRDSFDLVLMLVNFLYLLTNNEILVQIFEEGKKNAAMFDDYYERLELAKDKEELINNNKLSHKEKSEFEKEKANSLVYEKAFEKFNNEEYEDAESLFGSIVDYKEAKKYYEMSIVRGKEKKKQEEINRIKRKKVENRIIVVIDILLHIARVIEGIVLAGLIIAPIVFAVLFGIILFSNVEQISDISSFGGWLTGWIFYLIGVLIAEFFMFCAVYDKIDEYYDFNDISDGDIVSWIVFGIVAVLLAFCIIYTYVCASHLNPNYNVIAEGNKNSYNEVIELDDLYTYHCDYAIIEIVE